MILDKWIKRNINENVTRYFYLSEDEFTIHEHGQGTKIKKHFICAKILCNNII
jgi:hypothetical protein